MSIARLVITAVTAEDGPRARWPGLRPVPVCVQPIKRFEAEGEAAFEPRSRRPHSSPRRGRSGCRGRYCPAPRASTKKGLDAGAETIAAHLAAGGVDPVPSTIWRIGRLLNSAAARR